MRYPLVRLALFATAIVSLDAGSIARAGHTTSKPDTVVVTNQRPVWRDTADLVAEYSAGARGDGEDNRFSRISALAVGRNEQMFVADAGMRSVREFKNGEYVRRIGRQGRGKGEYAEIQGIALTPNGRVLVRDGPSGKILVYGADGAAITSWPLAMGDVVGLGRALLRADSMGGVMAAAQIGKSKDLRMAGNAIVHIAADGKVRDTLLVSDRFVDDCPISFLRARVPVVMSFSPQTVWTVGAGGEMVAGCGKRYSFDVTQRNGRVLRVSRAWTPVPISKEEREDRVAAFEVRMRQTEQGWTWAGPPHPSQHPAFSGFIAAEDGRIWVITPWPSDYVDNPVAGAKPARVWSVRYGFDVFDTRGVFQGTVRVPDGMRLTVEPVIRGDTVWAARLDDNGTPMVTRYRLRHTK